ncbi:hypothetical protein ACCT14_15390 [Rhizobium brockwellii]|jgi:hypothetical protein|uniref:hypothetical protein n=1 Tax=Rhizobium TaxID=379 RepID=UPI0009E5CC6C|nr:MULTISPECIES: hypothetical protein [Rhizobium]QJX04201.1 hypothetical protein RLCC275e_04275 [Rhizobium brockwellii]QND15115.1 hypothetical protein HB775_15380 [Rhizobium leguminosarum bv. trifolii]TAX33583.1 hypothetical protein ELI06_04290 [Rhizobium leguminosarum]TAY87089.1 hypothetical protein ELH83_04330 [Rhizobium leguminosarum]
MGFIFGGDTGKTQGDISDQRKRLAYAMLQQGMDASPIQSPWEGVARLAEGGLGGLAIRQQRQEQQAGGAAGTAALTGQPSPSAPASPGFLSLLFGSGPVGRTGG